MKNIITWILLAIDLYVMVTADLIVALIAFIIGILFLFHIVFEFDKNMHTKKE